jgi:hypothetical protein
VVVVMRGNHTSPGCATVYRLHEASSQ